MEIKNIGVFLSNKRRAFHRRGIRRIYVCVTATWVRERASSFCLLSKQQTTPMCVFVRSLDCCTSSSVSVLPVFSTKLEIFLDFSRLFIVAGNTWWGQVIGLSEQLINSVTTVTVCKLYNNNNVLLLYYFPYPRPTATTTTLR